MTVKLTDIEIRLLQRIQNSKARGDDTSKFNEIESKTFNRLCGSGITEVIHGYAYVTDKGIKKLKSTKI